MPPTPTTSPSPSHTSLLHTNPAALGFLITIGIILNAWFCYYLSLILWHWMKQFWRWLQQALPRFWQWLQRKLPQLWHWLLLTLPQLWHWLLQLLRNWYQMRQQDFQNQRPCSPSRIPLHDLERGGPSRDSSRSHPRPQPPSRLPLPLRQSTTSTTSSTSSPTPPRPTLQRQKQTTKTKTKTLPKTSQTTSPTRQPATPDKAVYVDVPLATPNLVQQRQSMRPQSMAVVYETM